MPSFAIIIPCFNEAKRLQKYAFIEFIKIHNDVHIYFVDDGSTDETQNILIDLQKQSTAFSIISLQNNIGKGEAIRAAMLTLYNKYDYIGYLDADLSTSLEEFYGLYQTMLTQIISVVFGSRIKKLDTKIERSYGRHMIGRVIATIIDKKFKLGCYDTQCGAKIFSSEVLKDIIQLQFYTRWFFDVELFVRIQKQKGQLNALEVPLSVWQNVKGSKLTALSFTTVLKELYLLLTKY